MPRRDGGSCFPACFPAFFPGRRPPRGRVCCSLPCEISFQLDPSFETTQNLIQRITQQFFVCN
ncbi:hypothetical protein PSAB6_250130 [Paraburkholderia sabiae]|nr:hypothetical protein PSAB6_250130 [Paraburkholderia sabiae]